MSTTSHVKEVPAAGTTEANDFDALKRDFQAMQSDLKLLVQALSEKGHEIAGDAVDGVSESSKKLVGRAESTIRQRPLLAVLLAFVVGMLLGRLFVSRR